MAKISDSIESFIITMLDEDSEIELKRNELAQFFGCAPSQINYVLTTRFSIDKGYVISSKRGGSGSITVTKIRQSQDDLHELLSQSIGREINQLRARDIIIRLKGNDIISEREARLMISATADTPMMNSQIKDYVRANILRAMITELIK